MIESGVAGFVVLLMAAAAIAVLTRRVPIPYVTALAIAGAVAGLVAPPLQLHLTRAFILFVLVPGLVFEAAFNLRWRRIRQTFISILALSTAGVLLTTAVVALLGHAVLGLALPLAVLLGAMLAPTDPIAVVGVFRRLGLAGRLSTIIEGESLFNDATGVVLFTVALGATAAALSPWGALVELLQLALGGAAVGLGIGFLLSWLTRHIDDPQVEITFTAIGAYGSYLSAEALHGSGILAVVLAGLIMGNFGRTRGMSEATQSAVAVFWDYVAFLLNSVVFLLVGLDVPWRTLVHQLPAAVTAAAIVIVARAITVYGLFGLSRPFRVAPSLRWQHLIFWSGLRGAIAIALALSLGESGGQNATLLALVYGVVLISLVVQGLTMQPLARLLLVRDSRETG